MTSILTNSGAIVALQTLRSTNDSLAMTQREISTGKRINSAADGSAIWAVAKTMETDRDTFKTLQQGLTVAAKVVSTAVENANGIVDDLNVIKQRLTASAKPDQDVTKNWDEIKELIDGIKAKISGSQINGVNLLNKQGTGDGATGDVKGQYTVLASLDRSYGNAQTSHTSITVESADLQTAIADVLDGWTTPTDAKGAAGLISGAPTYEVYTADNTRFNALTTGKTAFDPAATTQAAGARTKGEEAERNALIKKYGGDTAENGGTEAVKALATTAITAADYDTNADIQALGVPAENSVEALIDVATKAAAKLGAKQHRIESQEKSVSQIKDNLTAGIGALVDTNLEEASAHLKALQTQQQLGIQSLSIANQAPGAVLALFR